MKFPLITNYLSERGSFVLSVLSIWGLLLAWTTISGIVSVVDVGGEGREVEVVEIAGVEDDWSSLLVALSSNEGQLICCEWLVLLRRSSKAFNARCLEKELKKWSMNYYRTQIHSYRPIPKQVQVLLIYYHIHHLILLHWYFQWNVS